MLLLPSQMAHLRDLEINSSNHLNKILGAISLCAICYFLFKISAGAPGGADGGGLRMRHRVLIGMTIDTVAAALDLAL